MNENLTSSRWAPSSSRNHSPAPRQAVSFHNILNGTPSPSPLPQPTSNSSQQLPGRRLTALQKRYIDRHTAVDRYTRLFRRLRHKSHFLIYSHHQALASPSSVTVGSLQWGMESGEAETMFRVDFFEWYVLLERCLVEALSAVEISISATYDPLNSSVAEERPTPVPGSLNGGIIGDRRVFREGFSHRFHANVLSALDQKENNPLHETLGNASARQYIGVAKEFRNKWKDVDSNTGLHETDEDGFNRRLKRYERILNDLKLDEMLGTILHALEEARLIVEKEVSLLGEQLRRAGWDTEELQTERATEDAPWEASADAMELG